MDTTEKQKPQLHPTGIDQWFRCAEKARRIYLEHERGPRSLRMLVGTAVDAGFTHAMRRRLEAGALPPIAESVQVARDSFGSQLQSEQVLVTQDEGSPKVAFGIAADRVVRMSNVLHSWHAPKLQPKAVQRRFVVVLNGFPVDLAGTIDLETDEAQSGGYAVRDLKTTARRPSKQASSLDDNIQLVCYSLAGEVRYGAPPEFTALDYVVDTATRTEMTIVQHAKVFAYDGLFAKIEAVVDILEKGVFPPAPVGGLGCWWCSPTRCEFWDSCKYRSRERQR